jgi:hypothetical protein
MADTRSAPCWAQKGSTSVSNGAATEKCDGWWGPGSPRGSRGDDPRQGPTRCPPPAFPAAAAAEERASRVEGPRAEGRPSYSLSHSSSAAAGPGGPSADSVPAAAPLPAATAAVAIRPAPLFLPQPVKSCSYRRRLARSRVADAAGASLHVTRAGPWWSRPLRLQGPGVATPPQAPPP